MNRELAQALINLAYARCQTDELAADFRSRLDVATTEIREVAEMLRRTPARTPRLREARTLMAETRDLLHQGRRRVAGWDVQRLEHDADISSLADALDPQTVGDDEILPLVRALLGEEQRRQSKELTACRGLMDQIEDKVNDIHALVGAEGSLGPTSRG